jgi:hypothetical protein
VIEIHHALEVAWVLVITMWGNNGIDWQPIGQLVLKQPMLEQQCEWLLRNEMWEQFNNNQYYKMTVKCFPEE